MKPFGLQLYSLKDVPSLKERLHIAAESGYDGVEFAGYDGFSPETLREMLESLSLSAMGTHISLDALQNNLDGEIDFCTKAGIRTATCPWAPMENHEQVLSLAKFLEECAERFAAAGIVFCYHNHAHEFASDGDKCYLETLIAHTKTLGFELDVYWAAYAGFEPVAFLQKHAGRFPLLHLKEMAADRQNVELGKGVLDFTAILNEGKKQGVLDSIVEQEEYTMPPIDSVRVDADFLKKLSI